MYFIDKYCKHIIACSVLAAIISIFALAGAASAAGIGIINGGVVNVRSGPGTSYTIVGTLLKNSQVQIVQIQGDWDEIQFGSLHGWVNNSLITAGQPMTTSGSTATAPPRVLLDGKELSFEVAPVIANNRTLVPLRAIFEAMGATVQWDESSQTITATKGNKIVVLPLNSTSPTINGIVYPLDTPAEIINNRTLAPLRFVCEAFDGTVTWDDEATWTIYISNPQANVASVGLSETSAISEPAQPDNSITLSSSCDENGLQITMQSGVALTPDISQSSGQVVYTFKGSQVAGTNYISQALGSDSLTVQAANDVNGTAVTFKLPTQVKYNTLSQNNGKTLIFLIPNYIINLKTADYGNNSKEIILSTLCPVKYTSQQTGDQVQISLLNILQGKASSKYYINDQNLKTINVTSVNSSTPGIILNIAANDLGTVSFETSETSNNLAIILNRKTAQSTGTTVQPSGTTNNNTAISATYPVIQEYVVCNRPGTAIKPVGQVVHSTADPGATAQNIRDYFNNGYRGASTHAVIDWNSIIEMIPENEMAWHAGPTANSQYLSFEMCEPDTDDPDRASKFQEVWNRAVWYCAKTCVKYGWNTDDNIFSHYGISMMYHETNHTDPYGYFATYGKTWDQFLAEVDAEIIRLSR
jgi:N-acetylmuramoyl-L-alanine amidase